MSLRILINFHSSVLFLPGPAVLFVHLAPSLWYCWFSLNVWSSSAGNIIELLFTCLGMMMALCSCKKLYFRKRMLRFLEMSAIYFHRLHMHIHTRVCVRTHIREKERTFKYNNKVLTLGSGLYLSGEYSPRVTVLVFQFFSWNFY